MQVPYIRVRVTLDKIVDVCNNIIHHELFEQLKSDAPETDTRNHILDEVAQQCNIDEEQALALCQATAMLLFDDAVAILKEHKFFARPGVGAAKATANIASVESGTCPFLVEVWSGDTYDREGIDGLEALRIDLETQLKTIDSEESFIACCVKAYFEDEDN